jgi:hypothetical protein
MHFGAFCHCHAKADGTLLLSEAGEERFHVYQKWLARHPEEQKEHIMHYLPDSSISARRLLLL